YRPFIHAASEVFDASAKIKSQPKMHRRDKGGHVGILICAAGRQQNPDGLGIEFPVKENGLERRGILATMATGEVVFQFLLATGALAALDLAAVRAED